MAGSSDSSSDSDDDRLKDAIDPDFQILPAKQPEALKRGNTSNGKDNIAKIPDKRPATTAEAKSNRPFVDRIGFDPGHFVHPLQLTESNREFVYKQLTQSLETKIKETKHAKADLIETPEDDSGIFLFASSTRPIRGKDLRRANKKKHKVQKCKKSDSESDDDSKLKSVAVDAGWVLNPKTL